MATAFATLDFDEENVDEYRKGGDKWDRYKQELYQATLDAQFNLRRGDDFKAY